MATISVAIHLTNMAAFSSCTVHYIRTFMLNKARLSFYP
jgi:hypothetical protein